MCCPDLLRENLPSAYGFRVGAVMWVWPSPSAPEKKECRAVFDGKLVFYHMLWCLIVFIIIFITSIMTTLVYKELSTQPKIKHFAHKNGICYVITIILLNGYYHSPCFILWEAEAESITWSHASGKWWRNDFSLGLSRLKERWQSYVLHCSAEM